MFLIYHGVPKAQSYRGNIAQILTRSESKKLGFGRVHLQAVIQEVVIELAQACFHLTYQIWEIRFPTGDEDLCVVCELSDMCYRDVQTEVVRKYAIEKWT